MVRAAVKCGSNRYRLLHKIGLRYADGKKIIHARLEGRRTLRGGFLLDMDVFSYQKRLQREMDHWGDDRHESPVTWFDLPTVQRYINQWVSGRPDTDWLDALFPKFVKSKKNRGLVVGCGHGDLERQLLERDYCDSLVAFDISPRAIEQATTAARNAGYDDRIEYLQLDANAMHEKHWRGEFDVVFGPMALHHFVELERSLQAIRDALHPNGILFINEYIGPSLFQWTDLQVGIVDEILAALPDRYLEEIRRPGTFKKSVYRPTKQEMEEEGFEAVRSQDVLPAVKSIFEVLEVLPYGGTLLHILFEAIAGNFNDGRDLYGSTIVSLCCLLEKLLLRHQVIPHDHAVIVARNSGA